MRQIELSIMNKMVSFILSRVEDIMIIKRRETPLFAANAMIFVHYIWRIE